MKKLLIVGSDFGTVSVVKAAHKMGYYVITADYLEISPTKEESDESWLVSTNNIDELEYKSREAGVEAVMFGASDFNISNCRELCKRLHLPIYCDDDTIWDVSRDKRAFKTICKEVGAPVATDYLLNDDNYLTEARNIIYPVVVKPSDKSGNRGMGFCKDEGEFIEAYQAARKISDNSIIVERMLHGPEYNVHYALADGEASLLYFSSTHHEPGQPSNIYSFKCTTSHHLKQYIEEVDDIAKLVIKKVGCREGIVWFDIMRDADEKFYLLEMGYRFGGVMTYVPYEKVSGFDTVKWMLEIACGIKHRPIDLPKSLCASQNAVAASYHLFSTRSTKIGQIEGLEEIEKIPNVYLDVLKRQGVNVRGMAGMGLIGIYGEDIEDLCLKVAIINNKLSIKDQEGRDIVIKFDDYDSLKKEYRSGLREFGKIDTANN